MAEYWKSTPRYWCKFCTTYIRDTPLERRNHDATARHQSALQRHLRRLHQDTARTERDRQRARDEVARLNGVVAGGSSSSAASPAGGLGGRGGKSGGGGGAEKAQKQATVEERKRQMAQLAALGVAVPEDYRREVAMAGEWETVAVSLMRQESGSGQDGKGEVKKEGEIKGEEKSEAKAFGVRKRKLYAGDEEDEDTLGDGNKTKPWGARFRKFPGGSGDEEDDIEALLGAGKKIKAEDEEAKAVVDNDEQSIERGDPEVKKEVEEPKLDILPESTNANSLGPAVAEEKREEVPGAGIVFKKRKKAVVPRE
ncbi:MAG: hypothetical protein M1821_003531 [Bathelium mastoideum]|nr:MAG: hypothetical protein M1821_003531 [Bathelium mastoideum]